MIQAVRRMLKVRPIRSATLLVFGFHAPSMMSLLGVATDITWCPALVAAMVEPLRLSLMVLKGAGLASLADIASDPSSKNDVIELVITVVAFIMVLTVVVAAVRTAQQFHDNIQNWEVFPKVVEAIPMCRVSPTDVLILDVYEGVELSRQAVHRRLSLQVGLQGMAAMRGSRRPSSFFLRQCL